MKSEPNNEMDLLLRQLSRRNGVPVSEIDEQHLDADELNSYVANALPAAARVRYMEHLADCSTCRKLVTQLVAAQGPVPAPQTVSTVAPSGLKAFLASLFSPMVLRYAVPALGLIVIAVVGLFMLRSDRRATPMVQVTQRDQGGSVAAVPGAPESPASQPVAHDDQTVTKTEDQSASKTRGQQRQPVAPVGKDGAVAANQPAAAAGAAAAPPVAPPKVAKVESEEAPSTDLQKQKKQEAAAQPEAVRDEIKSRAEQANTNRAPATGTASVTVTQGQTARKDIEVRSAKSRESTAQGAGDLKRSPLPTGEFGVAGEMRSVGGRSFRKRGNVWVDTGFDSSKAITNVARGSEQYRALVADEPSIRTIAEQLPGEIIVVWKGRTYRIR